eukprot:SAG31_NODE_4927_length_2859_cov_1.076087_3_plen_86_part_01
MKIRSEYRDAKAAAQKDVREHDEALLRHEQLGLGGLTVEVLHANIVAREGFEDSWNGFHLLVSTENVRHCSPNVDAVATTAFGRET